MKQTKKKKEKKKHLKHCISLLEGFRNPQLNKIVQRNDSLTLKSVIVEKQKKKTKQNKSATDQTNLNAIGFKKICKLLRAN